MALENISIPLKQGVFSKSVHVLGILNHQRRCNKDSESLTFLAFCAKPLCSQQDTSMQTVCPVNSLKLIFLLNFRRNGNRQ